MNRKGEKEWWRNTAKSRTAREDCGRSRNVVAKTSATPTSNVQRLSSAMCVPTRSRKGAKVGVLARSRVNTYAPICRRIVLQMEPHGQVPPAVPLLPHPLLLTRERT